MAAPEAAAARQGHSFMPCFLPEWEQHYRPSPCPVPSLVWWLHWGLWSRADSPAQGQPGSATAGKLCPHCWLWPGPSATSSALTRDPAPWQLCSGATEPICTPFQPAPQGSASPLLSGSVQSMRQMLGTRAGAVLAVMSSGGFCHLTRATFLAKTNVPSHTSQLPLQHGLLLPGLREGRGWRSDAKVLKYLSACDQTESPCPWQCFLVPGQSRLAATAGA